MGHSLIIILGTVAIYLALFIHVAFSPKLSKKLIMSAGSIAVICGLIFYGCCFASVCDNLILAIIKTCHAVCLLFVGQGSTDAIADAPMMQYVFVQIIFHCLSFMGIFTTAGAAVSAMGAGFLRKLRLYLQWNKDIAVIQPLTPKTLEFARELAAKKNTAVVFTGSADSSCVDTAHAMGAVVRTDGDAASCNEAFLRSLGKFHSSRKLALYALSDDLFANRQYARNMATSLQARGISSQQTSLTIFANESETQNTIASRDGTYTFGSTLCISQEQMAARLLMHKAPLWQAMSFDENGRAAEDFHALLIGSGKVGQAVLKQIVMNGQFSGSNFYLSVFDPNFEAVTGQLHSECRRIFENYNIRAFDYDARSCQMYDFLQENLSKLKYIVVCTGDDDTNREVSRQLYHFLSSHNASLPIHICSRRGLQRITANGRERWDIFTSQVLCSDDIDRKAMLLNHSYCGNNGKTARENWADCDYFSRMSSRASADFAPAFLKMAGLPADAVPTGDWCTPQQLENMAISEHERWRAFHYCMGFRAMTQEEFADRCRIYREEKAKNPASRYRIGKDVSQRIHCCLIPWDQLDALSEAENSVTGGSVDYKAMDRNNVLTLPALLEDKAE